MARGVLGNTSQNLAQRLKTSFIWGWMIERAVFLMSQAQDDKIAELKRKLAAAQPAYAFAGAEVGGGGGAPSLEQLFAGLGSGEMLPAGPVRDGAKI